MRGIAHVINTLRHMAQAVTSSRGWKVDYNIQLSINPHFNDVTARRTHTRARAHTDAHSAYEHEVNHELSLWGAH